MIWDMRTKPQPTPLEQHRAAELTELELCRSIGDLTEAIKRLETTRRRLVAEARRRHIAWTQLALELGTSRQAAQEKYRGL